jgi:hypothetical protein
VCRFWRSGDGREFCFPLTEFEYEESLPETFRREIMEQYHAYDKLTRCVLHQEYGSHLDVLKIIREFYENATVAGAKLNYNRLHGVGRIEQDLTSAIVDSEEREEAERVSDYLAAMCDESLDDVTTIPIAALLDEITSGKLKDALRQIRSARMKVIEDKKKKRQALFDTADASVDGSCSKEAADAKEE